jgi:glycosyltransferase involved in cell wall biosynthesis
LFVGRITSIKNIFFILDSLKLLNEDGYNFKMLYVGEGADLKKLQKKIKEYNLEDKVIANGPINDRNLLSAIYTRANLFLFPSLFDASSLVQIEAAVNETPGLFIDGAVTADTVINGVSGYTCELDNTIYKDKIKEILNDKKQLAKVSKNAREMLGKSWETIAKETYNLYIEEIKKMSN